ncbi:MAG: DALR domain-containing protein, partial [Pyrinomonadaceae bacterium]
ERLRSFRQRVKEFQPHDFGVNSFLGERIDAALAEFTEAMDDDFNTATALASIHNLIRDVNTSMQPGGLLSQDRDRILEVIQAFDSVLGIFGPEGSELLDADIEALIEERQCSRRDRDFARSDEIRDLLAGKGIVLEDTKDGVRWKRK